MYLMKGRSWLRARSLADARLEGGKQRLEIATKTMCNFARLVDALVSCHLEEARKGRVRGYEERWVWYRNEWEHTSLGLPLEGRRPEGMVGSILEEAGEGRRRQTDGSKKVVGCGRWEVGG